MLKGRREDADAGVVMVLSLARSRGGSWPSDLGGAVGAGQRDGSSAVEDLGGCRRTAGGGVWPLSDGASWRSVGGDEDRAMEDLPSTMGAGLGKMMMEHHTGAPCSGEAP
ncbi:hypothetical protein ACLOJK_029011 [Asimina triloba]